MPWEALTPLTGEQLSYARKSTVSGDLFDGDADNLRKQVSKTIHAENGDLL